MQTTLSFEKLNVSGHKGFLMVPKVRTPHWLMYAPTLVDLLPNVEERWLFEQCLAAGISITGIDVGESYGNKAGQDIYTELYCDMVSRGFSKKVVFLGRSRGGLMALAWAINNAGWVAGVAGIYPVYNLDSYPGIYAVASTYGMTPTQLKSELKEYNPVDRLDTLAAHKVPLFSLCGDKDIIVPYEMNSGLVRERYIALGGKVECVMAINQGHSMWEGYFTSHELVAFIIRVCKKETERLE